MAARLCSGGGLVLDRELRLATRSALAAASLAVVAVWLFGRGLDAAVLNGAAVVLAVLVGCIWKIVFVGIGFGRATRAILIAAAMAGVGLGLSGAGAGAAAAGGLAVMAVSAAAVVGVVRKRGAAGVDHP